MFRFKHNTVNMIKHYVKQRRVFVSALALFALVSVGITIMAMQSSLNMKVSADNYPTGWGIVGNLTDKIGTVTGKAADPLKYKSTTLQWEVQFYADGTKTTGHYLGKTTTTGATHNFIFTFPNTANDGYYFRDDQKHSFLAYVMVGPNQPYILKFWHPSFAYKQLSFLPPVLKSSCVALDSWNDQWVAQNHDVRQTSASNACIYNFSSKLWTYTPSDTDSVMLNGNVVADVSRAYIGANYTKYLGKGAQIYQRGVKVSAIGGKASVVKMNTAGWDAPYSGLNSLLKGGLTYLSDGLMAIGSMGPNNDMWGDTSSNGKDSIFYINTSQADGPPVHFGVAHPFGGKSWSIKLNLYTKGRDVNYAAEGDNVIVSIGPNNNQPVGLYNYSLTGVKRWFLPDATMTNVMTNNGKIFGKDNKIVNGAVNTFARKQSDGSLIWSKPGFPKISAIGGGLIIALVPQPYNALRAYNENTGNLVWETNLTGPIDGISIALGSSTIVARENSKLVSRDLQTGALMATGPIIGGTPVIVGNRVYISTGNSIETYESSVALDTANQALTIVTQPTSQTVSYGRPFALGILANGTGSLSYRWYKNGAIITGATGRGLNFQAATESIVGSYTVKVTGSNGSVTSKVAIISLDYAPTIITQPQSASVLPGQKATFTVTTHGKAPIIYQWKRNGVNIAGATNSSYALTVKATDDTVKFTVVVTSSGKSVTSVAAVLTTLKPPQITLQPTDVTVISGSSKVAITLAASGYETVKVQKKAPKATNFTNIPGATLKRYGARYNYDIIKPIMANNGTQYRFLFTNKTGTTISNVATLHVKLK